MSAPSHVVKDKLARLRSGEKIITNDVEMDAMLQEDDETMILVASISNPNRVGILDQYVAWIPEKQEEGSR